MKKTVKVDLFAPVWAGLCIGLCMTGRLDWWVLVAIMLSHFEVKISL